MLAWDKIIGATIGFIRGADCRQNQAEFAQRFGISRSLIANIESGRTPLPAALGWKICCELEINPSWIISGGKDRHSKTMPTIPDRWLSAINGVFSSSGNGLFRDLWPTFAAAMQQDEKPIKQVTLDNVVSSPHDSDVKEIHSLPELLSQLRKLTNNRGAKTALANDMHISRQAVDQWLSEESKPTAEMTFELISWVKNQSKRTK